MLYGINGFIVFKVVKDSINSIQNGLIFDIGAIAGCWFMLCGRNSEIMVEAFDPESDGFGKLIEPKNHNGWAETMNM